MEKKLRRAIKNLQKSTKTNPTSNFSFEDLESRRSYKAKVFFNKEKLPEVEIFESSGYEKEELISQLNTSLITLFSSSLPNARKGSKVYTRKTSNVGSDVTLDIGTYYYAIDASIFDCTGQTLGSSFQAKCIKVENAKCSPTSEMVQYTVYELL